MSDLVNKLYNVGIVPVIVINDAKDAKPLAEALYKGGLPCAEVTFRTDAAEESIKIITDAFPDMIVGAGTILTTEQVDRAIGAGAKFIVSPGLNPKIVAYCTQKGVPIIPGCANPSDIEQALEQGLDVVKFFPAEAAGGLNMIKSMSAPYTKVRFMPTGGISAKNLNEYLAFPKIVACGGSWMVSGDLIKAGAYDKIEELTREAVSTMLGFEIYHVGINTADESSAVSLADTFEKAFGFTKKVGNSSVFAGTAFEMMMGNGLGQNGHIAIATNFIERAIYHLELRGFKFNEDSKKFKADGSLAAIYFEGDFAGFALHLLQK